MTNWLLVPFAYLLGSVSTAVIVSRFSGLPDPRNAGSKNPGATNVLRLGGKKAAVMTLLGDAGKGLLPIMVARYFEVNNDILAAVGLAAFLGHIYPIFFRFKGGKGVATALGVLLGFSWAVGLAVFLTWILTALITRYSSLSALVGASLAPVYVWFIGGYGGGPVFGAACAMTLLLISRHRGNIERLLSGTESKIGRKR
jgi:glycerol-3-phosphate acyltransferase PlsY